MEYVVFKGVDSRNLGIDVISFSKSFLPEIRDELEYLEWVDGPVLIPKSFGIRMVSVTFRAYWNTEAERENLLRKVSEWLYSKDFERLDCSDEPEIYYMAKVYDGSDLSPQYFTAEFTITFTCLPLKYGAEHVQQINTSGTVYNNGTYESYPKITASINASADKFELTVNSIKITYEGSVSPGQTVTVDSKELELRINGALKVKEVDGIFPVLMHGNNTISTNVQASITVEWQEYYL